MGSQHCSAVSRGDLARRSKFPYKTSTARCPRGFSHRRTNVLLFLFCASSVIEPYGYCRSHNHTATRSAMLQSIMPSARLARYRQRRYAKHCSAASPREALQSGANSRTGHQTEHIRTTSCTSSGSDMFFIFIKAKCVKRYCIFSWFVLQ